MADLQTAEPAEPAEPAPLPVPEPASATTVEPVAECTAEGCPLGKRKADGECEGSADNKCVKQQAEAPEGSSALPVDPPAAEGEPAPVDGEATDAATPVDFVTELVDCPPGMVGRLIGKGGETIRTLEAQSGTRIQIDHETKKVSIAGSAASVAHTLQQVNEMLAAPESGTAPGLTETVECPMGLVGRIIGRGGETIKGLQAASGATISIDQNFPEGAPRLIHVSGAAASVELGKRMVQELLEGGPSSAAQIIGATATASGQGQVIECPKDMVGRVIGRGGETIKGLQHHSGARIQIDQTDNPCKVSVTGAPYAIGEAVRMITDIVNGGSAAQYSVHNVAAQRPAYGGYGAPTGYPPYGGYPAPGYGTPGYGYPQAGYGGYPGGAGGGYDYNAYAAHYGQQPPYDSNAYAAHYGQQYAQPAAAAAAGGASAAPAPAAGAGEWQALQDGEGRTYYYNSTTGVSQWERPEGMP